MRILWNISMSWWRIPGSMKKRGKRITWMLLSIKICMFSGTVTLKWKMDWF